MPTHPKCLLLTTSLGLLIIATVALWPARRAAAPAATSAAAAALPEPAVTPAPPAPAADPPAGEAAGAVPDRYAQCAVLAEQSGPADAPGRHERVRLVQTTGKYPLVRVVDRWEPAYGRRPTGSGPAAADAAGRDAAAPDRLVSQTAMVADRVLVKLRPGATAADLERLAAAQGARREGPPLAPGLYLVHLARPGLDAVPDAVAAYRQAAATVSYAEPDYLVYTLDTPNDPHFGTLWGLHNTGQAAGAATVAAAGTTRAAVPLVYSALTPPGGVTGTLYDCGLGKAGEFPAGVSGNLAVIQRGAITAAEQAANAQAAGARAVIVYNNVSGSYAGSLGSPGDWLPVVGVAAADGAALLALGQAPATVSVSGCVSDADIDAPEAWAISHGSSSVVVGVIDTGIDYHHPDLAANMWTNPGEVPGNGLDDDGNGYVDDVHGYDFVNNDGEPLDDFFHGTHCAGTIGAVGNNGVGVVGVCWNVRLMALKFMGADGAGAVSDAVRAVSYATRMGARLTSNSWGGGAYSQALKDEIDAAGAAGALFVAAAGNSGSDNDRNPTYPGSYPGTNIVAVAATDCNDRLASFSCYGLTAVDLGAPGVNILSIFPTYLTAAMSQSGFTTDYGTISGTSMATPHVAGVAALLVAVAPGMAAADLKDWLLRQTDPVPALAGKCVTGGRLNAFRTASISPVPDLRFEQVSASDAGGNADGFLNPGEPLQLTVTLRNLGLTPATGVQGELASADPYVTVTDPAAAFADTLGYGSLTAALDPCALVIAADCPTPRAVALDLRVTDAASHTWTARFTVPVYASSRLAGRVAQATGGAGIAGATVTYAGPVSGTATTDAAGAYQFSGIDGTYILVARAAGYLDSDPVPVTVPPSRSDLDFALGMARISIAPAAVALTVAEGAATTANLNVGNTGDARLTWSLRAQTTPLRAPGAVIREFALPAEIDWPFAMAYDGAALWLSVKTSWTEVPQVVYKLDPNDGHVLGRLDLSGVCASVCGLYRTGNTLWVTDNGSNSPHRVLALDAATGAVLKSFAFAGAPYGLSLGEGALWVADRTGGQGIKKLNPADGTELGKIFLPIDDGNPGWPTFIFGQIAGASYLNGALWTASCGIQPERDEFQPYCKANPDDGRKILHFGLAQEPYLTGGSPYHMFGLASDGLRYLWFADRSMKKVYCVDSGEVAWLRAAPESGTVVPGAAATVALTADALVLDPGTYTGTVLVKANDTGAPTTAVPVTLTVTAGPRLVYAAHTTADAAPPAVGDGDGAGEPGETLAVTVSITNDGHADAAGLTGQLTSGDGYATVLGGTAAFPDAAVGATVAAATPFVVQLAGECPNDRLVPLTLVVSDGAGRHWALPLTLHVSWRCQLTGTVTDARSGAPLAGARVTVDAGYTPGAKTGLVRSATTGADGSYALAGILAGTRTVSVAKAGYAGATAAVAFPPNVVGRDVQLTPPNVTVTPSSLTQMLRPGQTASQTLTLANAGPAPLDWSVTTGTSGYSVSTSDQPGGPVYNWIEIAGTGTPVYNLGLGGFHNQGPFAIGFNFPFYGNSFNTFRLNADGWLSFTSAAQSGYLNNYFPLPNAGAPENLVSFLGLSLAFPQELPAWYQSVAADTLVIEVKDAWYSSDYRLKISAQAILKSDGSMIFQYRNVAAVAAAYSNAQGPYVGVQDAAKTTGVTVFTNAAQMRDGLAVKFTPTASWLTLSPAAGTAAAAGSSTVTATFATAGLADGTYHLNLQARSADPAAPVLNVPVTLTVAANANQPPTLDSPAWADPNPVALPAGTTVHVMASDPDGDPLTYAWSQVSGAGTASFASPTAADSGVTFSAAGTYVLRVTVADGKGGSVFSDVSVTVNPGSGVDPRADVNHDGVVNALDLQIVIANFGQTVGSPGCDARADANADGVVNALDLQIVIANFGQAVP